MAERTAARYQSEIAELRSYLAQAYPAEEAQEAAKSDRPRGPNNVQFRGDFHAIDRSYPGVQVLHTDPDILVQRPPPKNTKTKQGAWHQLVRADVGVSVAMATKQVVPNFLTEEECERLIRKATPHMVPCLTKNPRTGAGLTPTPHGPLTLGSRLPTVLGPFQRSPSVCHPPFLCCRRFQRFDRFWLVAMRADTCGAVLTRGLGFADTRGVAC